MGNWGVLVLVIAVFVANIPAVMQQWRTDRPGFINTLWLFGIYALYVALGIVAFLWLEARHGTSQDKALLATGVMVGWIFYGGLTLMRVVPRYREPPRWLMRFGIAAAGGHHLGASGQRRRSRAPRRFRGQQRSAPARQRGAARPGRAVPSA